MQSLHRYAAETPSVMLQKPSPMALQQPPSLMLQNSPPLRCRTLPPSPCRKPLPVRCRNPPPLHAKVPSLRRTAALCADGRRGGVQRNPTAWVRPLDNPSTANLGLVAITELFHCLPSCIHCRTPVQPGTRIACRLYSKSDVLPVSCTAARIRPLQNPSTTLTGSSGPLTTEPSCHLTA